MFIRILLLSLFLLPHARANTSLHLDPKDANQIELRDLGNGEWEARTTGNDPYFYVRTDGRTIDLKENPMFSFDYFTSTGIGKSLVFVGPVLDIPHLLNVDLGSREAWSNFAVDMNSTFAPAENVTSLRLRVGDRPGIVARFRNFQSRPATEAETRDNTGREQRLSDDRQLSARLASYLSATFPHRIDHIGADNRTLTLRGTLASPSSDIRLAEIPMWEDITALKNPAALHTPQADPSGKFTLTLDLDTITGREPLLSSWALVRKNGDTWEPLSHARYIDDQKPRAHLPRANPASLKGIGGMPFDHPDMEELGIHSLTLNFILNNFFLPPGSPGGTPYEYAGRTWKLNDTIIADYDRQMLHAAKHDGMVSAIILITPQGHAPEGSWIHTAGHPHANPPGIYVLPDFTTREGTNAYAAAMNFVTERYSRPDGKYGRVHHWIMHNEINSGFFWANAGDKTSLTYLDLYQKSMRVAHILARRFDPHAKALISFEHCWNIRIDPRSHPAKELLDHLVRFSRAEGDFEWGLAYHPYAQDIRNPRVWEDSQATFDINTPYLTYRNLEVLDAWVHQPSVAFRGTPREIQFTEQGVNSPDYSGKILAEQSASMAYIWKKIETMKTVTAFQYHLWADDHSEGGLRLGLRRFGDDPSEPHGIKPIWHIYKAIGTPAENEAFESAKQVIGIGDWDEIIHRGSITGIR